MSNVVRKGQPTLLQTHLVFYIIELAMNKNESPVSDKKHTVHSFTQLISDPTLFFMKIMSPLRALKSKYTVNIPFEVDSLHKNLKDYAYEIDEMTFNDLMLPEFNEKFNHTKTSCGDELFDHWSRSVKNERDITSLQNDLSQIMRNNDTTIIAKYLNKLGKQKRGNIVTDLWNGFKIYSWTIDHFREIFLVNILLTILLSVIFAIINSKLIPLPIMLFFVVNMAVYIATNRQISNVSGSINYFIQLCACLKKIEKQTKVRVHLDFPDYRLFKHINWCSLLFKEGLGGAESQDLFSIIIDYLRVFFCLEIIAYKMTSKFVLKHIEKVRNIIYYVGYLDCCVNSKAILEKNDATLAHIGGGLSIAFKNMRHPLLADPVGQTKKIERGIIVTGLNMAGKTSFMKSLGLNQLLSTSFGFAFASEFNTTVLQIMTSFRINDNLLKSQSRYYAEAYRLVELKNNIHGHRSLCLIDEILSGTNSDDRIFGATAILKNFSENEDSIIISATHDNKIAENLSDTYDCIYFDGEIVGNQIIFDYTIKEGIVSKRNGLLILKLLGIHIKEMEKEDVRPPLGPPPLETDNPRGE